LKSRITHLLAFLVVFAFGLDELRGAVGPAPTPDENPEGETGVLKPQVTIGGSYDPHSGNATRMVNDLHVPGALGMYGLDFTRYWNSIPNDEGNEAAHLPVDFADSSWTHSWRWAAVYNEEIEGDGESGLHRIWTTSITITYPDGHASKFKILRVNFGAGALPLRMGPPYVGYNEINWPSLGATVHDFLVEMAPDGHEFWLRRGDGGAVHFWGVRPERQDASGYTWWNYDAIEVFDPHGFKTDLVYDGEGYLKKVQQPGNRWLDITWSRYPNYVVPFISKVETGGDAAGQSVTYKYNRYPYPDGSSYVLGYVGYENQPAPGQTAWAGYTYGNCVGDVDPCPGQPQVYPPLLKTAYDPHYAGAITKIKYNYGGGNCQFYPPGPTPPPAYFSNVFFLRQAIAAEKSAETGETVSRFEGVCGGERSIYNGIGGVQKFYFGTSAHDPEIGAPGYMLTKMTDFGLGAPSSISRKQKGSEPVKVWDGRGIETDLLWADGKPSQVNNLVDGSHYYYNRVTPSAGTLPLDSCMHNPASLWLHSKTDEGGKTTTYVRDGRRRITRIDYDDGGSYETYEYDNNGNSGLNQVTRHRLPSGAVVTYEYDAQHRLRKESNDIDTHPQDYKEYTYYGQYDHPEWADLVKTMTDGRGRSAGALFTVKMTYNGRQQVMSEEYPSTDGVSHPTVQYQYDRYGNCIAITDETGHRKDYTYDSYRRCTSLTEGIDTSGTVNRRWDWIYDRYIDGVGMGASTHTSKEWRVQVEPVFNDAGDRRLAANKFDCNNRIIEAATGLYEAADGTWHGGPDTEVHHFTYDQNGQKSSYTDPLGRVTDYEYNLRNRLWKTTEHPLAGSTTTSRLTETLYDERGNKTEVIFPDLKHQRWENHDAFGQPARFIDERNNPTDFIYCWGPMKKLYKVTTYRERDAVDGGGTETQVTTFGYDWMGRATQTIFPDTTDEFTTYKFGQIETFKTRKNQVKTILYDARGREVSNSWSSPAAGSPPWAPGISRVWDNANRLTQISNIFAAIGYSYDVAGQMVTEGTTVTGSGALREVTYGRYPNGEVSDITYPDGSTGVHRIYTARDQLQQVNWGAGSMSYVYHPDGKINHQTRSNGVTTTYGYNGRGMVSSVTHRNEAAGRDLAKREYWRDERDRILAWKRGTDGSWNSMEDGRGNRYGYDDEGQLTAASYRVSDPDTDHPGAAVRVDSFPV
jgi:YD repeat-containing protein